MEVHTAANSVMSTQFAAREQATPARSHKTLTHPKCGYFPVGWHWHGCVTGTLAERDQSTLQYISRLGGGGGGQLESTQLRVTYHNLHEDISLDIAEDSWREKMSYLSLFNFEANQKSCTLQLVIQHCTSAALANVATFIRSSIQTMSNYHSR